MCINSILFKMDNIKKQLINLLVILLIAEYCRVDGHRLRVRQLNNNKDLATGCYHNGTMYADRSMVPTMEPCLFCKCMNKTLVCALKVCQDQPMPPPRGCILVQKKNMCCPYLSCTKLHIPSIKTDDRRIIIFGKDEYKFDKATLNSVQERRNHLRWADDEDDDDEGVCIQGGTIYREGSAMSSSTLCSYCYCIEGREKCVKPKCLLPVKDCVPVFVDSTCCPIRYDCDGKLSSPKYSTKSPNTISHIENKHFLRYSKRGQRSNGCTIDKVYYPEGQKLPKSEDPCEICFCIRGARKCTMQKCTPPVSNCLPRIPTGQCCAASFDCKPTDKPSARSLVHIDDDEKIRTFQVIMPSQNTSNLKEQIYRKLEDNEDDEESFDLLSLFFGPDEPTTKAQPLVTTKAPEFFPKIPPTRDASTPATTTTTESSFFDFLRAGLEMIDTNDDIEKELVKKEKLIPTSTSKSIFDSLFGDDNDEEEVTIPVVPIKFLTTPIPERQPLIFANVGGVSAVISAENIEKQSSTETALPIVKNNTETFIPVSLIRHHTKISDLMSMNEIVMPLNSSVVNDSLPKNSSTVPFKPLPNIPNLFLDKKTTETKTSVPQKVRTTTMMPMLDLLSQLAEQIKANAYLKKKNATASKPLAKTEKTPATKVTVAESVAPVTEEMITTTISEEEDTTTDMIDVTTTEIADTETTTNPMITAEEETTTDDSSISTTETETPLSTTDVIQEMTTNISDVENIEPEHKEIAEITTAEIEQDPQVAAEKISKLSIKNTTKKTTLAPVKETTTESIFSVIFSELQGILNSTNKSVATPASEVKAKEPERVIGSVLTPRPLIKPIPISNLNRNPSILEADYNYDYSEPTLPPSLPNLKIIPFLATDAVKNDRNKNNLYTPASTVSEFGGAHSVSIEDAKTDYKPIPIKSQSSSGSLSVVNLKTVTVASGNNEYDSYNPTQYPVITEKYDKSKPTIYPDVFEKSVSSSISAVAAGTGSNVRYNNRYSNDKYEPYDEYGGTQYNPHEKIDTYNVDGKYSPGDYENNLKYTTDDSYLPAVYKGKYDATGYSDVNNYYHNAYTDYNIENKPQVVEKPETSGFSPPTKTEGGFVPKEPIKDDFYYENYHTNLNLTVDITSEEPKHQYNASVEKAIVNTTDSSVKDVLPPHLNSLVEDKEKMLNVKISNYSSVDFHRDHDFESDIISITTDTNYNITPEYSAEIPYDLVNTSAKRDEQKYVYVNPYEYKEKQPAGSTSTRSPLNISTADPQGNNTKAVFSFEKVINYLFRDEEPIEDSDLYKVTPDLNETVTVPSFKKIPLKLPVFNFSENTNISTDSDVFSELPFDTTELTKIDTLSTHNVTRKNVTIKADTKKENKTLFSPTIQDLQFLTTKFYMKSPKPVQNTDDNINGISTTAEVFKTQPIRSDLSVLLPEMLNKIESYNNYQILPDNMDKSKHDSTFAINPVDITKMKQHHSEGAMEVFTKPANRIKNSAGILKLAGCNIYGRMYRVGRIISELSNPCLECKCTDVGVHCTPLKC